jgi:hypothetical protein
MSIFAARLYTAKKFIRSTHPVVRKVTCLGCILVFIYLMIVAFCFQKDPVIGWISLAGIPGIIMYSLHKYVKNRIKGRAMAQAEIEGLEGFSVTQLYIGEDAKAGIALDEEHRSVCFVSTDKSYFKKAADMQIRIYPFSDILQAEIQENGKTVTYTSRFDLLVRPERHPVYGRVDETSGTIKVSEQMVTQIQLKVVVNDTAHPTQYICFYKGQTGIHKNTEQYKEIIEFAEQWHGLMSVAIKRGETQAAADEQNQLLAAANEISGLLENKEQAKPAFVADEIRKLHELVKEGLLTKEEFEQQKKKLIDGS